MQKHSTITSPIEIGFFASTRRSKQLWLFGVMLLAILAGVGQPAARVHAQETADETEAPSSAPIIPGSGGYVFESMHDDITINEDGSFDVIETIRGQFYDERHGLFRYIPVDYVDSFGTTRHIEITVTEVSSRRKGTPYELHDENGFRVIRIGDANQVITGPFEYTIKYHVEGALLYQGVEDELYWNVTGSGWDVTPETTSALVHLTGVSAEQFKVRCFTGPFGSPETACQTNKQFGQVGIESNDFLTISVLFPTGIVREPSVFKRFLWWLKWNWDYLTLLAPLFVFIMLFHRWLKHGKDPKGTGVEVVQYDPPEELRPSEVGTLIDARVHGRDFSAAIVDLAVRGYLVVEEEQKSTLGIKSSTFTLKKQGGTHDALKPFEKDILETLFRAGDAREMKKQDSEMLALRKRVEKTLYKEMAEEKFFVKNPNTTRSSYIGIGVVILLLGWFIGEFSIVTLGRPLLLFSAFGVAGLFIIFGILMPKRTEKGMVAYEHAKGFKEYLEKAEKYRIQWQEKEGMFEKFLPYAMVFGVADKWSKALAVQEKQSPAWYVGPSFVKGFDATQFSSKMSSFLGTIQEASAPKSSGGGQGGGFSGGGFGGGGGGSW